LRSVILVFAPLALAAILTIAASVLLNLPFNFANVIVLPLLFGLGVASGIHLVIREGQTGGGAAEVLSTSTPRAVLFSALTTIGSFGSMALSGHPGTASMGLLLTVAIGLTLGCTLVVLPALMAVLPLPNPPTQKAVN
jgi:predicted RND superfamily exporter protein